MITFKHSDILTRLKYPFRIFLFGVSFFCNFSVQAKGLKFAELAKDPHLLTGNIAKIESDDSQTSLIAKVSKTAYPAKALTNKWDDFVSVSFQLTKKNKITHINARSRHTIFAEAVRKSLQNISQMKEGKQGVTYNLVVVFKPEGTPKTESVPNSGGFVINNLQATNNVSRPIVLGKVTIVAQAIHS